MRLPHRILGTILLLVAGIGQAEAGFVITPGPSVSLNVAAFGGTEDERYQQIYSSALLLNAGVTGPIQILGLGFSPNRSGVYTANVAIRLNQTTTAVGALSTTFDDNVTGALTTVFNDPTFSQSVIGGDLTYTLRFNFAPGSFIYDPTSGENLLVDILVADKDGSASWAVYRGNGYGLTSRTSAQVASDNGLRTMIEFEPAVITSAVPEPSSVVLALCGLITVSVRYRRRG